MKRYFACMLLFCLPFERILAQQNVVLLVDVSASVPTREAKEAKIIIRDIVLGTFKLSDHPGWTSTITPAASNLIDNISGNGGKSIISNGSLVSLYRVGSKATTLSSHVTRLLRDDSSFTEFIASNYPQSFPEPWTYLQLAHSLSACEAARSSVSSFLSIDATDDRNSTGNEGDKTPDHPNYSSEELNLISKWDMQGFIEVEKVAVISKNGFAIYFRQVDLKKASLCDRDAIPDSSQRHVPQLHPRLDFTNLHPGSDNNLTPDDPHITWVCKDCPKTIKYQLQIKDESGNVVKMSPLIQSGFYTIPDDLNAGNYSVLLKGVGMGSDSPFATAGFKYTKGRGQGSLLILLLVVAAVVAFILRKAISRRRTPVEQSAPAPDPVTGTTSNLPADDLNDNHF